MQKGQEDAFQEVLLLWEKEHKRKKKRRSSLFPLLCLGALAIAVSVCSYHLFDRAGKEGEIASASTFFSDFAEENEAIAVFLGLDN